MTPEPRRVGDRDDLPRGPVLGAALAIMAAGIIHLLLVENHMGHALGAGLFFAAMGVMQVGWAAAFLARPSAEAARLGIALGALTPTVLYAITRLMRAPWADGPEHVDALGVASVAAQVLGALLLVIALAPAVRWPSQVGAVSMGVLLGIGAYAGALVVEPVPLLTEPASLHGHGDHSHGEGGHVHAEGHEGHDGHEAYGVRGMSIVGTVPYYGPGTARELVDACNPGTPDLDCYTRYFQGFLVANGSVDAFDLMLEVFALDPTAGRSGHDFAHTLGHFAYQVYGYDIEETLATCSYEVFQGCLHGALQAHFSDVAASGDPVQPSDVRDMCTAATTTFEQYACLHGVGHGVTLYTNYDRDESLRLCDGLPTRFGRESCYGGVFMENVVGYFGSLNPVQAHHDHQIHDEPPEYWIDEDDPAFPCNAVITKYGDSCWRMQTSIILRFNGGNFAEAAAICDDAGEFKLSCYVSLGRDAGPRTRYDPARMSAHCAHGDAEAEAVCVEGFSAGVVLNRNDPWAGLDLCRALADHIKEPCYRTIGRQANRMWPEADTRAFCAEDPAYEEDCLRGGRLL